MLSAFKYFANYCGGAFCGTQATEPSGVVLQVPLIWSPRGEVKLQAEFWAWPLQALMASAGGWRLFDCWLLPGVFCPCWVLGLTEGPVVTGLALKQLTE